MKVQVDIKKFITVSNINKTVSKTLNNVDGLLDALDFVGKVHRVEKSPHQVFSTFHRNRILFKKFGLLICLVSPRYDVVKEVEGELRILDVLTFKLVVVLCEKVVKALIDFRKTV